MQVDLRKYVVETSGSWDRKPDSYSATKFVLSQTDDAVALLGPLRIRVTLQGENHTSRFNGQAMTAADVAGAASRNLARSRSAVGTAAAAAATSVVVSQTHVVYSYLLNIPPLQVWTYRVRGEEIRGYLGTNAGYNIVIQPGGSEACYDDSAGTERCPPGCRCRGQRECGGGKECGCGCSGKQPAGGDLPCNYAVTSIPNSGRFFPVPCEPCPPDAYVSVPPPAGPRGVLVRPASGGCERPRYFNGMFITREDMESEQRFFRLKMQLHNRALGAGVVWGFCLGRDGNDVVVYPGYGVDCCGNDLAVTSPYRVDIRSLVRDPAAAALLSTPGAHRMHLLLEYAECPEDPRPVHGDACSAQISSCEMSRIRESTRLRLVPPRDFDTRGPIQRFLDELIKIRPVEPSGAAAPAPSGAVAPELIVPFSLDFVVQQLAPDNPPQVFGVQPPAPDGPTVKVSTHILPVTINTITATVIPLPVTPQSAPWRVEIVRIEEFRSDGTPSPVIPSGLSWDWTPPELDGQPRRARLEWRATRDDTMLNGTTDLSLAAGSDNPDFGVLFVEIPPSAVTGSERPSGGAFPCLSEACGEAAGEDHPLFPAFPPFLHADPYCPVLPADPKVVVLAALYGWLAGETESGNEQRLALAKILYTAAARLLFGLENRSEWQALADNLKKLLADWCKLSLYPGPRCEGEPHGIVIGCALVEGGDLQSIDPWGGRRYVMHYPLVSHRRAMFGIAPRDLTAQRFYSLICCLAGLSSQVDLPSDVGVSGLAGAVPPGTGSAIPAGPIPLGAALLFIRRASAVASDSQLGVTRVESISIVELITRLLGALGQPAPAQPVQRRVRFSVDALGVSLVIPEEKVSPGAAPAADPQRLRALIERTLSARSIETAVAPLLRSFSADLASALLSLRPLPVGTELRPLVTRLVASGIDSLGALLGRDPEALYGETLSGELAAELTSLVDDAERNAQRVTTAVGDSLANLRSERLVTRTDLTGTEPRAALVKDLGARLRELGPDVAALDAIIFAAAQRKA